MDTRHFIRAPQRCSAMSRADGSLRSLLARFSRIDVLVIDDWAMAPLAEAERRDFWEICEDRYQTRSTNAFLAVDDVPALQAAADRLSPATIRKQLDYWTLILGPKFSKKERDQTNLSRFYAIAQIEYCRNFIFKRHFPIHKIFERSCEIGLWRLTANRISEIFGVRLNKRLHGKLATVIDQIEHGHHVFRAYWKNALLKQYEKFSRFLRNELCSNNLRDFGLRKGLDHLDAVRKKFQAITGRFAHFQAECFI